MSFEIQRLPVNFWSSDVMPDGVTIIGTERETRRVYKSVDEGLSWTQIFQVPSNTSNNACLTFCDSFGNIYVSYPQNSGGFGGLWRSSDGGLTFTQIWQDPNKPETSIRFRGLCQAGNILYFGTSYGPGGPCDVYRSIDQGQTWTKISAIPLGGKHIHTVQYNPYNGWFYAVVGDPGYPANGLWRSKDNCLSWEKFTNIGDPDIMSVGFYHDYVYAAIHWEQGQVRRLLDNDNLAAPFTDVFQSGLRLQNWVQQYNGIMLTGGEDSTQAGFPVGIWASNTPPFNAGTWTEIFRDGALTGYKGTACASHKTSLNGWLFVANNYEGEALRLRSGAVPPIYSLTVQASPLENVTFTVI